MDSKHVVDKQPEPTVVPVHDTKSVTSKEHYHDNTPRTPRALSRLKHKLTTRDGWLGDYDYAWSVNALVL
jgi:uric acid-xanthine permease